MTNPAVDASSDVSLVSDVPAGHPQKAKIEAALVAAYATRAGGPWEISVSTRPGGSPNEWVVRVKSGGAISVSSLYADRPEIALDRIWERASR
ncbi:MAG TPA: hypothetical protein VMR21_14405 [Vicinamibacteria bacterium]|nr:hypothetical protein [Vicinamibacteria bacterium]